MREAVGDRDDAVDDLRRAVEAHERLGQPFELARTLLVLGCALRRAKQRGDARQVLERALSIFAELLAPRWRDRAADELARVGGPTHRRWELTPGEHGIAATSDRRRDVVHPRTQPVHGRPRPADPRQARRRSTKVVNLRDASDLAVFEFTIQPGAVFPWHPPGPVFAAVAQGDLVFIYGDDCARAAGLDLGDEASGLPSGKSLLPLLDTE